MESAANGSKLPGRTVLVVDDEEHVRTALTRLLEREGYAVSAVDGPTEALEILRRARVRVAAGHCHAAPKKELRQRAHSSASDPHKMDRSAVGGVEERHGGIIAADPTSLRDIG